MTADIELARFILVVSVLVVAFEYYRTKRVTGGSLTPGYLAVVLVTREWNVLVSVAVFTLVVYLLMRLVVLRWVVLTKPWVYGTGVMISALLHAAVRGGSQLHDLPSGLGLVLLAGMYITPGLVAYDLTQQGWVKTGKAIAIATAATLLVASPLILTGVLPDAPSLDFAGRIDPDWWWLAVGVAVPATLALRMARGLATAGYIGVVFLVEIASPSRIAVLVGCAVVSVVITRQLVARVILTPRQRFQLAMVTGCLTTWTVLFWGARWGMTPAIELDVFALEPLILVGLVTADLTKSTVARTLLGIAIASGVVAFALGAIAWESSAWIPATVIIAGVILVIGRPALQVLFRSTRTAVASGRAFAGDAV